MLDVFVTDWFTLMFAALWGWGLTLFLGRVDMPSKPHERFWLAVMVALAVNAVLYLGDAQFAPKVGVHIAFTLAGVGFRSFWELMLRQRDRAVDHENAARQTRAHTPYSTGDIYDGKH